MRRPSQLEFKLGSFCNFVSAPRPTKIGFVPNPPARRRDLRFGLHLPGFLGFVWFTPKTHLAVNEELLGFDSKKRVFTNSKAAPPDFSYALTLGVEVISGIPFRRVAALLLLFATAVAAADRAPDSPVYSRRVWQSADGLPEDYAQALAQTADGYLWVGTSGGLVRFDPPSAMTACIACTPPRTAPCGSAAKAAA
jgi:hypothetical protein